MAEFHNITQTVSCILVLYHWARGPRVLLLPSAHYVVQRRINPSRRLSLPVSRPELPAARPQASRMLPRRTSMSSSAFVGEFQGVPSSGLWAVSTLNFAKHRRRHLAPRWVPHVAERHCLASFLALIRNLRHCHFNLHRADS